MMPKKKIAVIACVCISLLLVTGSVWIGVSAHQRKNDLRIKYPMIQQSQYRIDDAGLDFAERVANAPHIVEIEVIGQLPNYTVSVEDPVVDLAQEVEFCRFQVKLLSDVAQTNFTADDGTFEIVFAKPFADSYPRMEAGMDIVCAVEPASGVHAGKYLLYDRSFYYIDSNMALAAYAGDDGPASQICPKQRLIDQIQKIRNQ